VTPADEAYVKEVRARIAVYPGFAREAIRRGEHDKAEEHWRSWRKGVGEILKRIGAVP
jgi:hypothetical protein